MYCTRIRPHTESFLRAINDLFELHIITFVSRPYAEKIAEFLDGNGQYFSKRIMSRDESESPHSKQESFRRLFSNGDQLVVKVDDRGDVWEYAPNWVPVLPFQYFQDTGDINAPPGHRDASDQARSILESSSESTDAYLLHLTEILKKIHRNFFEYYDRENKIPHTNRIVPFSRKKVLERVRIVFTGVSNLNIPLKESEPYSVAKSLGAKVKDSVTDKTTHVIAAKFDTKMVRRCRIKLLQRFEYLNCSFNKVFEAKKFERIRVVTLEWLWACAERWEHVEEQSYLITSEIAADFRLKPPAHCIAPTLRATTRKRKRSGEEAQRSGEEENIPGNFYESIDLLYDLISYIFVLC